jgi:hypothetical protein
MISQRLVRFGQIARQHIARFRDRIGRAAFLAPREVEQCTAEMPPCARTLP